MRSDFSLNSDESTLQAREWKNIAKIAEMYLVTCKSTQSAAGVPWHSTEPHEVHTQRTIADEGERSPRRIGNNPEVPR